MTHLFHVICLLLASMAGSESPARGEAPPPPSILTGTLVSARDLEPVAGGRVFAVLNHDPETRREMMLAGIRIHDPIAESASGKDGRFRLAVPSDLRIIVVAEAPDHSRARLEKAYFTGESPLQIEVGRIELEPGRSLSGKVVSASKPVAGATVIAIPERAAASRPAGDRSPPRRDPTTSFAVSGTTDEKGAFELTGLPRKPVTVRVFADGLAPGIARGVGTSSDLDVILRAGVEVTGRVVGPDGKTPVEGAWVVVDEDGWDGITRTKPDGTFTLENLRPGSIALRAIAAGTGPAGAAAPRAPIPSPSAPVSLVAPAAAGSPPLVLSLRPGGVVIARTVDIATRRPVAGARLSMGYPSQLRRLEAVTGSDGEVIYRGVPAERFGLYAEADDYMEENLDPRPLAAGETRTMSVAMRPAGALEGIVRDDSGRPLHGARVNVRGKSRQRLPASPTIVTSIGVDPAVSDIKGMFSLEKLPPGEELTIGVTLGGYAPWEMGGVEVRPFERRRGLEVILDRGATVTGRLETVDGAPITVAEIAAGKDAGGESTAAIMREDVQGASLPAVAPRMDGTFRVSGITPGLWSLDIRAPGFAPRTMAGLTIEGQDGLDLGDIVMMPGAVLAGEVLDAADEPVAFAEGTVLRQLEPFSTFTTAGDGTFVTDDLVPGEPVSITIFAPSYATFERAGLEPPMEDLIIRLSPSSSIRGVVIEKGSEDPIVDFAVSISKTQSGSTGDAQMTMLAQGPEHPFLSEDGTFTLNDVDPGKVNLTASATGYKDATLRDLVVPEGSDLEEVVLELERGALVSGTVFDDAGRPLPGVTVSRQAGSGGRGMMIAMGGSDARTDGDGAFVLDGLDRAEMTLAFELRGFETARKDVDTSISDVEGLRVTMSRGAELSGIVYREEDGSPVAGATVSAAAAGGRRRASTHSDTTASDGSFMMEGVSEGRYTVTAQASGLTTESVENVVVTERTSPPPIEIALGGGVTILGTVVGLQESELPSLTVQAMEAGGGFSVTAPVDGAGRFEVRGMNPGSVSLYASTGFMEGRTVSKTVDIPEGVSVHEVTLEFPEGHTVEGYVLQGDKPVDGVTVRFKNRSTRANVSGTTNVSGYYVVTNVQEGNHDVSVFEFSFETEVSVDSSRRFDIDLPTASISGHVTETGSSERISGAIVKVEGDGESWSDYTGEDGYYEVSGLPNGTYTVTAGKNGYASDEKELFNLTGYKEVDFSLSSGEVFSFQARDLLSGTAPPQLTAMVPGRFGPEQLYPNASGVFNISLQRGNHTLVLGGVNFATEIIDINAPGNGGTIMMEPGADLTILVDGLENNLSALGKLLVSQDKPYWVYVTSDPTFPISQSGKTIRVKPGTYTLEVKMPGETNPHRVPVTVPAQNTVHVP